MGFFNFKTKAKPIKINPKDAAALKDAMPVSGGRESEPETTDLLGAMQQAMGSVEPDFDVKLIDYIKFLAKYNSDVSYAVDNIVQLGNTAYTINFGDDVTDELAKEMTKVVMEGEKTVYKGGYNSLINDLLAQVAISGAISAEIVPTVNLDDILRIVMVNASSIRFKYDPKAVEYAPYQLVSKTLSATIAGNLKPLNPITYKYYALRRFDDRPYAVPPMLSSLESVQIEREMICSLKSIVKKLGVFGFVSLLVTPPKRLPTEAGVAGDAAYQQRCLEYLEALRPEAEKGFASGLNLGFKDTHEFKMDGNDMNVDGARELFNLVSEFKMAGLKQDPLMLGRNFNVAETMARVILAKLSTQIKNYQLALAAFMEDFFKMKLLLKGYTQIGNLVVEFEPAMVSDKSKEEEAYTKKIANADSLYNSGIINQQQRAQMLGYDEPDQEEPRFDPNAALQNKGEDNKDTKGDTSKTNDDKKKDKQSNKRTITYLTSEFVKELVDIPVNLNGGHTADITLSNGEIIEDVDIFNFTRVESVIPFNAFDVLAVDVNTVDSLAFKLHKGSEEFCYVSCSSDKAFDVSHFAKETKLHKYLSSYFGSTKKVYDSATKKVTAKIGKALSELGEGASLEQYQDKVLATLYKQWGSSFSQAQQKVINKWVEVAYREFRKTTDMFAGETKIPISVFGVKDYRTMEYFKNSDSLYLGKFITDEDTKKRITAFVKKEYLENGSEIGRNPELLDKFKREFEGVLDGESWKITNVLSTTVNKMRNYAALNYMEQAGVETFEVLGVNDRLQCGYCASMQGREFTMAAATKKLDGMINTSPEYVAALTPFVSQLFKGKEGLEELASLSDAEVQERGIDVPSYHCNCRDRIVAKKFIS